MPLQATSGAASYDAFGGGVAAVPNYIEDVFSTWLYDGTGASQTINNGIDLSTKGGLVWIKTRSNIYSHVLSDTARGATQWLNSASTDASVFRSNYVTAFNSNGFSVGDSSDTSPNFNTMASWTFREQSKFFDIVTYTGDGVSNRAISHNLGSIPGCILLKRTDSAASWFVYHRATGGTPQDIILQLNTTDALATSAGYWGTTPFTDTQFRVSSFGGFNASGGTYVAYLFAHNAGGFGLTGTDNVISCGSFSTAASGYVSVNLGYEPQWLLWKKTSSTQNWQIADNMRGFTSSSANLLYPNLSLYETEGALIRATATGFEIDSAYWGASSDFIYIAIRRGPMKVPTDATKVLAAVARSGNSTQTIVTGASSPPDLVMVKSRNNATEFAFTDRLRGVTKELSPAYTFSEADFGTNPTVSINMNGWTAPAGYATFNQSGYTYVDYLFSRYPNVFDEVCYSGTGAVGNAVSHNLGVAPELMIIKARGGLVGTNDWQVLSKINAVDYVKLVLNANSAELGPFTYAVNAGLAAQPTSTTFTVNNTANFNNGSTTYVAYLFATCPGVSKVGSYTGTGAAQVINCGFTTGARWVMIKRTDSTGDWYVWDTARGMVSGTDPFLIMNDALAETNANYVFTSSTGFTIQSGVPAAINANGGTFIFLAIA